MKIEVKVPSVGESVSEAGIENWEKKTGDFVKKGEILVTLETDKASMEIPAEKEGYLEILKNKGETVSVGERIAFIELSESKDISKKSQKFLENNVKTKEKNQVLDSKKVTDSKVVNSLEDKDFQLEESLDKFHPSVRHLLLSQSLSPSEIKGTGRGGRLIKEDVLNFLNEKSPGKSQDFSRSTQSLKKDSEILVPSLKKYQRRETMTRLRKVISKRLVQSQRDTATLSTFNEVDLSRIIEIRRDYQEEFIKKYGFKLGFMSFFVKAVVVALKEYPKVNAFIEGDDIIYNEAQHIGVAIGSEKGLLVPVLFHAQTLSLAQIEEKILSYRDKILAQKISPEDLLGGTFTISNGGVFGSLLSTPILNPPQSGILGMHKIEQRPVAIHGKVEIRPMMYLALSYDHRILDGKESVGFLVKVKEGLEEPSRLLIDI